MKLLTELKDRSQAKTPEFWRKAQIVGATIGGIGLLITTFPVSLPAGIVTAGTYMITVGATIGGVSQLTVSSTPGDTQGKATLIDYIFKIFTKFTKK
jgi:hypothetical protein